MLRDRGPLHNIGYGVTSRDFEFGQRYGEMPSPESGFVSRALHDNPILKMAAAMLATGLSAGVAGKLVKTGGLKLGYRLSENAAASEAAGINNLITRAHRTMLRMRSLLDEYQGVARPTEGKQRLVYRNASDILTTGYDSVASPRIGYAQSSRAVSAAQGWSYRNELQQQLVKQARRLPYEVPAFYVADKTIGRTFYGGEKQDTNKKKNWYDPSRVTDFAKDIGRSTLLQVGGFMLPAAGLAAAKNSSINFFKTAEQRWDSVYSGYRQLSPTQKKIYQNFNFLKGSLSEVGQDLFKIFDKTITFGERSTGALAAAFTAASGVSKNPVLDLHRFRHGSPPLGASPPAGGYGKQLAEDIASMDLSRINRGINTAHDHLRVDSLLDLIPGYKSARQGVNEGLKKYKNLQQAQKYIRVAEGSSGSDFDDIMAAIRQINGLDPTSTEVPSILSRNIQDILNKRTSPLLSKARAFEEKVGREYSQRVNGSFERTFRAGRNFTQELKRTSI